MPTDAIASATMPSRTARPRTSMPRAPTKRGDEDEQHPRDDDRVRRGLDPHEHQRPRRAEVGDRRVRHGVGADRDPAAHPAVGPAHEAAAPLVGAAGDRELRRQLGVHREQQALARERDRQHPDPRGPGDDRADERDAVQPDDRRDRGEAERDVVAQPQPARELLRVAQLGQARGVRVGRRGDRGHPGVLLAVALDRARDVDPGGHAELHEDVAQVRLDGLLAEEERARDPAVRVPVGHEVRDLQLARVSDADAGVRAGRGPAGLRPRAEPPQLAAHLVAHADRAARRQLALGEAQRRDRRARDRRPRRARARRARGRTRPAAARRCRGDVRRLQRQRGGLRRVARRRAGAPRGRGGRGRRAAAGPAPRRAPRCGARRTRRRRGAPARARRGPAPPSRSCARRGSCASRSSSPRPRMISHARSTSPASNSDIDEHPPRPAAARGHRLAGQPPADLRALLGRRDGAVEIAGVVARRTPARTAPTTRSCGVADSRVASTAASQSSIASASRPCISNV